MIHVFLLVHILFFCFFVIVYFSCFECFFHVVILFRVQTRPVSSHLFVRLFGRFIVVFLKMIAFLAIVCIYFCGRVWRSSHCIKFSLLS